jgi:hypothetical protein
MIRSSLVLAAMLFFAALSMSFDQGGSLRFSSAEAQRVPQCARATRCTGGRTATCEEQGRCRRGNQTVTACLRYAACAPAAAAPGRCAVVPTCPADQNAVCTQPGPCAATAGARPAAGCQVFTCMVVSGATPGPAPGTPPPSPGTTPAPAPAPTPSDGGTVTDPFRK